MPTYKNKTETSRPDSRPSLTRRYLFPATVAMLLMAMAGIGWFLHSSKPMPLAYAPVATASVQPVAQKAAPAPPPATMVDEQQCQGCHSTQVKDWQGSHHQLAMQEANPQTVLADFNGVTFKNEKEST